MKKSYDQTFMLTTSAHAGVCCLVTTKAPTPLSALTPVRSVECGLFAQLALGFFAKKSVFYINLNKEISNGNLHEWNSPSPLGWWSV